MYTKTAAVRRILQLLLRCGMVCQEELSVVLEMMQAEPPHDAGGYMDAKEEKYRGCTALGIDRLR